MSTLQKIVENADLGFSKFDIFTFEAEIKILVQYRKLRFSP